MNAIIFHGTDCEPNDKWYWFAWLKRELEKRGIEVELPFMEKINRETVDETLAKIPEILSKINSDTILIGHSSGVPLILSILEKSDIKIRQAVLVAGYFEAATELLGKSPILQSEYDFAKIRENCKNFTLFNSTNDPWGCDDIEGKRLFEKLGGDTLIVRNDGHFGSSGKNQIYDEFPLLLKMLDLDGEVLL